MCFLSQHCGGTTPAAKVAAQAQVITTLPQSKQADDVALLLYITLLAYQEYYKQVLKNAFLVVGL